MRKTFIILLIGFMLLNISCRASSGISNEGYIVFTAVDQDGNPRRELVVLDVNGKELRRISLPDIQGKGPIHNNSPYIHTSHRAFIQNPGVAQYLVDVLSGEVKTVQEPGSVRPQAELTNLELCSYNNPGNNDWALLCRGNIAYLLNLETAEVYDILPHPSTPLIYPYQIWFSPGNTYIGISKHDGVFILPAANPKAIRQVGKSNKIDYVDFAPGDKRIVYVRPGESKGYEVVVEDIDGSQPNVLYTSDELIQAVFIPGQDQILVVGGENILLLSLTGRVEKEFPAQAGPTMRPIFSPQGGQALVGYHGTEVGTYSWQWLDLKAGITKDLPELEKKYIEFQAYRGQRWILFSETTILDQEATVDLTGVDLQTGSVQSLPTLEDTNNFNETSATADGQFRTGHTWITGRALIGQESFAEFWLLDLANGEATRQTQDTIVNGTISPNGKRIVVYSAHREGTRLQGNIVLQDSSGKILASLGDGFSPFWVWP